MNKKTMYLLKILYKAFYRTKNRKENTIVAFSGVLTYYVVTTLFLITLFLPINLTTNNDDALFLKVILFVLFIAVGFLTYRMLNTYANAKFDSSQEISIGVRGSRLIIFFFNLLSLLYVIVIFEYLKK